MAASGATDVGTLTGWAFAENAGAVARVLLRAGGAAGAILADIHLSANQSTGEQYGPNPIEVRGGVYVEVASGAVRGAVYGG